MRQSNIYVSAEPLEDDIVWDGDYEESYLNGHLRLENIKWVIVGAETGNRKDKIIPKRDWIKNIVNACSDYNVPVFLKNNLAPIWREPLIQQFPWGRDE
jgi:hypothetical protein